LNKSISGTYVGELSSGIPFVKGEEERCRGGEKRKDTRELVQSSVEPKGNIPKRWDGKRTTLQGGKRE